MKKFWYWLTRPFRNIIEGRRLEKRLKEIRKKDPFIYR